MAEHKDVARLVHELMDRALRSWVELLYEERREADMPRRERYITRIEEDKRDISLHEKLIELGREDLAGLSMKLNELQNTLVAEESK